MLGVRSRGGHSLIGLSAFGRQSVAQPALDPCDDVSGFGLLEGLMDNLLSPLRNACGQCQEQACEPPLGLLAFQRLELAEARFDHLTAGWQSLSPTQLLRLGCDELRQVLAPFSRA